MRAIKKYSIIIICLFLLTSCFNIFNSSSTEQKEYVDVLFYDSDNSTIIYSETIEKGQDASFKGIYPSIYVEGKNHEFIGWDKPLTNIIVDTEFYPTFRVSDLYYTVNFFDEDNTLLDTFNVKYNETINYEYIPTKESDEYCDYTFSKWYNSQNKTTENIKSNLDFYAKYETINHSFDVIFLDEDLSVLDKQIVKKGQYATYNGKEPVKNSIEEGQYVFNGFIPDVNSTIIDRNISFVATYKLDKYDYKVTFLDEDGTLLYETTVEHGDKCDYPLEDPVKPSEDPAFYYDFFSWHASGDYYPNLPVKENRVYTAYYIKYNTSFTVTYKDSYKTISSFKVNYGTILNPREGLEGQKDGYTKDFVKWDYDYSIPITSDTIINAIWSDWYYTKDGLSFKTIYNAGGDEYTYTVSCASTTYTTFMISGKPIAVKDNNKFYQAKITGVADEGFISNFVVKKVVFDEIDTLTNIGKRAFYNCYKLETVILNNYITRIEESAFDRCSILSTIYIPASVEYIGKDAFIWTDLQKVFYGGSKEQFDLIEKVEYIYLDPKIVLYYSETKPIDTTLKYWHYVDGVMTPWDN